MEKGYYSAAWGDIRNSKGWFGKLCLLALISMIPVFGLIVIYGYLLTWGREIAWNINRPMPAHIFGNEDGKLYRRGWFQIVIALVVMIVPLLVYSLAMMANNADADLLGSLLMLAYMVLVLLAGLASQVGGMRMAIYDNLGAGLGFKQIFKMMRHDFGGLMRILGMELLLGLIFGLIMGVVFFTLSMMALVGLVGGMSASYISSTSMDPQVIVAMVMAMIPIMLIFGYISAVATIFIQTMVVRAIGYWTRNFQVHLWGNKDAALPFETGAQPAPQPQPAPAVQAEPVPAAAPVAQPAPAPVPETVPAQAPAAEPAPYAAPVSAPSAIPTQVTPAPESSAAEAPAAPAQTDAPAAPPAPPAPGTKSE